jgi:hypothetical protein
MGTEFGFHGCFNMADLMSPVQFCRLLASNEPGLLGKRERRDLFRQAFSRWDLRLMAQITGMTVRKALRV